MNAADVLHRVDGQLLAGRGAHPVVGEVVHDQQAARLDLVGVVRQVRLRTFVGMIAVDEQQIQGRNASLMASARPRCAVMTCLNNRVFS